MCALGCEAGNAEPAGLFGLSSSTSGSKCVAHDLATGASSLQLGSICETSDQSHLCECGGLTRGSERALDDRRNGAAEGEHVCGCVVARTGGLGN